MCKLMRFAKIHMNSIESVDKIDSETPYVPRHCGHSTYVPRLCNGPLERFKSKRQPFFNVY